ncbi:alpha-L-fucosidase [Nocardia sp. NBC_00508]|uniref:alpha-L-fucosidase n=1 Tax=Nocardia sp. NBC_00508 TaxID=2975992 RepID=UPI002E81BD3C|nr:alpha-L-fucosidase [Nocardia sp. NBC_00508]WUD69456.1 alpha-L-fucosidase [Nocardia sp. NBC_00508]
MERLGEGQYEASLESLAARSVPTWFGDAKFGIFVHWGLFSVPGFAPRGSYADALRDDYDHAMTRNPYAEQYMNMMRDPGGPTAEYHRRHFGDLPYEGFKAMFEEGLKDWSADEWAETFRRAGAQYVVMVTKHHDGFALWPTEVRNPHRPGWFAERDLVGELAAAVRERGMKFGVYYSGGIDWTFQSKVMKTLGDYIYSPHASGYPAYADAQVRELITRYEPDILWNDISWPTGQKQLFALFAHYYNTVPDGVVNDRWQTASWGRTVMRSRLARAGFDLLMKQLIKAKQDFVHSAPAPVLPHSDFTTREYTRFDTTQTRKWEATRGIGNSFGFNRNETDADYASFEQELFPAFADAVAKNGNLLLNVGPSGGAGIIPAVQLSRLGAFGDWLRANGAAIYDTNPYDEPQGATTDGLPVRTTRSGSAVNVVVVGYPRGREVVVQGLALPGSAGTLLADGSSVRVDRRGGDTVLRFSRDLDSVYSPAVAIPLS